MARKGGATVVAKIPGYQRDRARWRQKILASALEAAERRGVQLDPEESYEVVVLLYMKKGKRHDIHDVDNRLKDIRDALQGRLGPSKASRRLLENDRSVCRVVMEKQPIPKLLGSDAGGRLMVRPYRRHRWPLQATKGHRLLKSVTK